MFRRNPVTATGYAFGYVLRLAPQFGPNITGLLSGPAPVLIAVDGVGYLLVSPATLLL